MSASEGLSDEVKLAIVQALACFDTPSETVRLVKDGFGVAVSRQAVEAYDPEKVAGRGLSPAHRAIFEATRRRYLAEAAGIGIAHRVVRLRNLHRLAGKAEATGNLPLAGRIIEQAAKEVGGAYTKRRARLLLSGVSAPVRARARG